MKHKHKGRRGRVFLQQLNEEPYRIMKKAAKKRGITLQDLMKWVIADWLRANYAD